MLVSGVRSIQLLALVWLVWTDTLMSICAFPLAANLIISHASKPLAEGLQQARTKGNCYGVTAPGFTPEHSKPKLRSRTCIFHPVTVRIRTYPFCRHSGLNKLTPWLSFFPVSCVTFCLNSYNCNW